MRAPTAACGTLLRERVVAEGEIPDDLVRPLQKAQELRVAVDYDAQRVGEGEGTGAAGDRRASGRCCRQRGVPWSLNPTTSLCVVDGHTGAATTNRTDEDALRDTARRAASAAKAAAQSGPGSYYEPGYRELQPINLTHNIFSDLLLRTGRVGFLLFVLALGSSLAHSVHVWRSQATSLAAALSIAATAVVVGLIAKGMVESARDAGLREKPV